jgi:hypothetical protein
MIGDEPEDGPDTYYVLKDFENAGVLNTLMEECEVQINLLLMLTEGTKADPDLSVSPFHNSAKEFCSKSYDSSLWKNLVWGYIDNAEVQDPRETFNSASHRIYQILNQKKFYSNFYQSENIINIPEIEPGVMKRFELRYYDNVLNSVNNHRAITEDVILGVAIEQVARTLLLEEDSSDVLDQIQSNESGALHLLFQQAFKKLSTSLEEKVEDGKADIVESETKTSP